MLKNWFLILVVSLTLFACSQSSAQRDFENEAFTFPENITEMTVEGRPVEGGAVDPEDWRIGPDFQGLIEFSSPAVAAYPNPVNLNEPLRIELFVEVSNSIHGIQFFVFEEPNGELLPIGPVDNSILPIGLKTVVLNPQSIGTQASGIYRILIYDNRQNLISYGDIEVQ